MFTKVPPRFFKVLFAVAFIMLLLMVSCTTVGDSLAMSYLAAPQHSVSASGGESLKLPEGPFKSPDRPAGFQELANSEERQEEAGEEVLLDEDIPEEPLVQAAPASSPAVQVPEAEKPAKTPASSETETKDSEKPEVNPQPAPEPAPKLEPKSEPEPEPKPEPKPEPEPEPKPEPKPEPVKYVWGSAKTVHFRTEVEVTNTGDEPSTKVTVSVPLLENSSPYQKTSLTGTNYPIQSQSGRTARFALGELEPGESKTIVIDYQITIRPVSISSTNEQVEKAKIAYDKYAGSGNCHTLSVGFVKHAKSLGLDARVVTGYKRKAGGDITSGSLSGARHSWAEFRVDGLGWVPVDLTHLYFARIPHASHVVETYSANQFLQTGYSGGSITTEWRNMIM